MTHRALILLILAAPAASGCVASIAASAVGAAAQAAAGEPRIVTQDVRGPAVDACRARAASEGVVTIIDMDQRQDGRVTVWGTVQQGARRRSFECVHDRSVRAFRLREIGTN